MRMWAVLDANNNVVNTIIAENEEIALVCSLGVQVIEYTIENPPNIGWKYLDTGEWFNPNPAPIPIDPNALTE